MEWTDVFKDAIGVYGQIETAKAQNQQPNWYQWGQPGNGMQQQAGGIPPVVLLVGVGVLAFVLLRD